MSVKRDIRFRVYISFTIMVLLGIAIIAKAVAIQHADEGAKLRAQAQKANIRSEILPAERGNIYTEDGTLLLSTIPKFDLRLDFKAVNRDTFYRYVDTLATCLASVFPDVSAHEFRVKLKKGYNSGNRYWLLRRNVPYHKFQLVREFPIFNKGRNRGGFIAESKADRRNPYGILAYRTLGLWRENAPNIGLELAYDSVLAGRPGARIIRKTTTGGEIPIEGSEIDPVNGKDIVTTIDINIQDVAEHALMDVLEKYQCSYGSAIVMEVETGKVRAIANLGQQKDGTYNEDFNYAMLLSEPGSTFKLFSLLALLDDGYAKINDQVDVNGGRMRFGNQTVVDDHAGMKTITLKKAFAASSNVAFASLVHKHYQNDPMRYIRHLKRYGLDKPTGIDLVGERTPVIKTVKSKSWNKKTSLAWIGYGYESMITPLHTCMVYNAVANDGKLMKPYLVSEIKEFGKTVRSFEPVVLNKQIAKAAAIAQAKEALLAVVDSGTAKGIASPYYSAGGKTGTAQVADKGITYRDGVRQGSFVGYFPGDKPKYTIMVLIRSKPHGVYYGSVLAAPVFKAIADKLYATHIGGWEVPLDAVKQEKPLRNLRSSASNFQKIFEALRPGTVLNGGNDWVALRQENPGTFRMEKEQMDRKTIPDLTGMGLKDALHVLELMGMKVSVSGAGKVKAQSLQAGAGAKEGQKIHLLLSQNFQG